MAGRQQTATNDFVARLRVTRDVPIQQYGKLLRGVASDIGEALVVGNQYGPGTPVATGWARGNWFAQQGAGGGTNAGLGDQPPPGTHGAAAGLTAAALEVIALVIIGLNPGDVVSYINNAAYIERLNNGWSAQAPAGMTDAVVAMFPRIVADNAQRLGIAP